MPTPEPGIIQTPSGPVLLPDEGGWLPLEVLCPRPEPEENDSAEEED